MLSDHPIYASIPVADLERAETWYREKLGVERSQDPPLPHGDEGVFFDAGEGTRFYLFPTRAGAGAGHTVAEFAIGEAFDKGAVRFGSIDEFVRAEVEDSPLVDQIDETVYRRILEDAREALSGFTTDAGGTEVPIRGHLITGRKR